MANLEKRYKEDADNLFRIIEKICETRKLKITDKDIINRRIMVSISASLFSWGENIEIIVSQQKAASSS